MTVKAIPLGINRFLDPAIPKIGGVRRDAMAYWASAYTGFPKSVRAVVGGRVCRLVWRFVAALLRTTIPRCNWVPRSITAELTG